MHKAVNLAVVFSLFLLLSACGTRDVRAPVVEITASSKFRPQSRSVSYRTTHTVRKGDTLYSIARINGRNYRELARINHIKPPYSLKIGQIIHFKRVAKIKKVTVKKKKSISYKIKLKKSVISQSKTRSKLSNSNKRSKFGVKRRWVWPVKGRVVASYAPNNGQKGLDIVGRRGQKVRAASAGVVAYSGTGLRGYGKLLIIKHNDEFLSAYAHNRKLLVQEGAWVTVGQVIAVMGSLRNAKPTLHFEIRRYGRPVDPLHYLRRITRRKYG